MSGMQSAQCVDHEHGRDDDDGTSSSRLAFGVRFRTAPARVPSSAKSPVAPAGSPATGRAIPAMVSDAVSSEDRCKVLILRFRLSSSTFAKSPLNLFARVRPIGQSVTQSKALLVAGHIRAFSIPHSAHACANSKDNASAKRKRYATAIRATFDVEPGWGGYGGAVCE